MRGSRASWLRGLKVSVQWSYVEKELERRLGERRWLICVGYCSLRARTRLRGPYGRLWSMRQRWPTNMRRARHKETYPEGAAVDSKATRLCFFGGQDQRQTRGMRREILG